jgi:hypothetical protein
MSYSTPNNNNAACFFITIAEVKINVIILKKKSIVSWNAESPYLFSILLIKKALGRNVSLCFKPSADDIIKIGRNIFL